MENNAQGNNINGDMGNMGGNMGGYGNYGGQQPNPNIPNMNNMGNMGGGYNPNVASNNYGQQPNPNMGMNNGYNGQQPNPNMNNYGQGQPNPNMNNGYGNPQGLSQQFNNLPPNVQNAGSQVSGFSLKSVFGVIDRFTRDIDKIMVGIGDSIESALNGGGVNNSINNINQKLEQAQQFNSSTQMNQQQENSNNGVSQGKVMNPVMGRSSIMLSNGNEVGELPETPEKLPAEYEYLSMPHDVPTGNMGQMVAPEIHSVLDKQEAVENKGVSLSKPADTPVVENVEKGVSLDKTVDSGVSLENVTEDDGLADINEIVNNGVIESNVRVAEVTVEQTSEQVEEAEVKVEVMEVVSNPVLPNEVVEQTPDIVSETTSENVEAKPVSLEKANDATTL